MGRLIRKTSVLSISLVLAAMLMAGCQNNASTDTKKSRLIATENEQLKKELEQCRAEVEKQKQLTAKCLEEKKISEVKNKENADSLAKFIIEENKKLAEENMKLTEENNKLKAKL